MLVKYNRQEDSIFIYFFIYLIHNFELHLRILYPQVLLGILYHNDYKNKIY